MKEQRVVTLLCALGNKTRLNVFRYLTRFGPDGVAAKQVAEALSVAPNSLSFHLKELKHAGLLVTQRAGREVDYAATHTLVAFLIEHCCEAAPDGCPPACRPEQRRQSHADSSE